LLINIVILIINHFVVTNKPKALYINSYYDPQGGIKMYKNNSEHGYRKNSNLLTNIVRAGMATILFTTAGGIANALLNRSDAAETPKNSTTTAQHESLTQEEINKQTGIIEDPNFIPPEDKITKGLYFEGDNLIFWKEINGYKQLEDSHGKFWFPYREKEQSVVKAGKDGKLNPELSSEDARNLANILYDYWVSPENKAKSDFQTKTDLGKILRNIYGINTKGTKYDLPANYFIFNPGERPVFDFVGLEKNPQILVEVAWTNYGENYKPPEAYAGLKPDTTTTTELSNGVVIEAKWYTLKNEETSLAVLAEMKLKNDAK